MDKTHCGVVRKSSAARDIVLRNKYNMVSFVVLVVVVVHKSYVRVLSGNFE